MAAQNIKYTKVYQKAFGLSMSIFSISKTFPREETYSLTDSDMENSETGVWLDFALACNYISPETHKELLILNEEIGRMLNHMICHPEKY